MTGKRIRALGLATALVGWSFTAGLDRPWRRHPVVLAAAGTALALTVRAPLGLAPPPLHRGLRLGAAAAGTVVAGVAATTVVPRVRAAMATRDLPDHPARWLGLEIPLGTVWSEETAFRAALATVAADAELSRPSGVGSSPSRTSGSHSFERILDSISSNRGAVSSSTS
jgi:hypothetical protein